MAVGETSSAARWSLATLLVGYLALEVVAGAPAAPLTPVLPAGAGPPGWCRRAASLLHLDSIGRSGLIALSGLVLLALVAAFLVLVKEARRERVSLRAVMWGSAAAVFLAVAGPILLSRDVTSYASYGRMYALRGGNPYVHVPADFPGDPFTAFVSSQWIRSTSVYGPVFVLIGAGIARGFAGSVLATVFAFKALAGVALLVSLPLVGAATRRLRPGREAFAVAALGLNPVVILHTVGGAHSDALMAALLAGAAALAAAALVPGSRGWASGRPGHGAGDSSPAWRWGPGALFATVLLTLAAQVKVIALIPLLLWIWAVARSSRDRWAASLAMHVSVAVAVAVGLFAPLFAGVHTLSPFLSPAFRQGWASGPALVARAGRAIGHAAGGPRGGTVGSDVIQGAALLAFAAVLFRILRRADARRAVEQWGTAMLLFALAAPYLLPWYTVWFLPFVVFLPEELLGIAFAVSSLLAVTGIPAEAEGSAYRGMLFGVHYLIAPIMLLLLFVAMARVARAFRGVAPAHWAAPRAVDADRTEDPA